MNETSWLAAKGKAEGHLAKANESKDEAKDAESKSLPKEYNQARPIADDRGLGVVRIKPLGAGGGGTEKSAVDANEGDADLVLDVSASGIAVDGKSFSYPSYVITPDMDQQALFDEFMPERIKGFLEGYNVNIMVYGQTGSGKTHTMFGPPGIMGRTAAGEYGVDVCEDYGLFPRGLLEIFARVQGLQSDGSGISYVLTASAVELSLLGNEDMMTKTAETKTNASWINGVALDKAAKPPRLFGMKILTLDQPDDLLKIFAAIATRNTAGTVMNDSSSRSYCFAFLTLHVHDPSMDTVRTSRFQFVDLAGNERMTDAHGKDKAMTWSNGNMEVVSGLMTNYSLMMLSSFVRALVSARKRQKKKGGKLNFSFRTYLFDLVILLQESMIGSALAAIFVCVSQAPANAQTSKFSLEFGQVFSQLEIKKKPVPSESRAKLVKSVRKALAESEAKLGIGKGGGSGGSSREKSTGKFVILRQALVRDGRHMLEVLNRFGAGAGDSSDRSISGAGSSAPVVQNGKK